MNLSIYCRNTYVGVYKSSATYYTYWYAMMWAEAGGFDSGRGSGRWRGGVANPEVWREGGEVDSSPCIPGYSLNKSQMKIFKKN